MWGNYFRDKLKEIGKTQKDLAVHCGLDPAAISLLLKGDRDLKISEAEKFISFFAGSDAPEKILYALGLPILPAGTAPHEIISPKDLAERTFSEFPIFGSSTFSALLFKWLQGHIIADEMNNRTVNHLRFFEEPSAEGNLIGAQATVGDYVSAPYAGNVLYGTVQHGSTLSDRHMFRTMIFAISSGGFVESSKDRLSELPVTSIKVGSCWPIDKYCEEFGDRFANTSEFDYVLYYSPTEAHQRESQTFLDARSAPFPIAKYIEPRDFFKIEANYPFAPMTIRWFVDPQYIKLP